MIQGFKCSAEIEMLISAGKWPLDNIYKSLIMPLDHSVLYSNILYNHITLEFTSIYSLSSSKQFTLFLSQYFLKSIYKSVKLKNNFDLSLFFLVNNETNWTMFLGICVVSTYDTSALWHLQFTTLLLAYLVYISGFFYALSPLITLAGVNRNCQGSSQPESS